MMTVFDELLKEDEIPRFAKVRYSIKRGNIVDYCRAVDEALDSRGVLDRISAGNTVAISAGSREINNMAGIIKRLVDRVKQRGGRPFIFPAMGSHGGCTARGQAEILAGYGITPQAMGVPVISSMETVQIGMSESGYPVHIDKNASQADCIIAVGRIKPHTDFRGNVESGLMKMLAIGMGKQHGAAICHKHGWSDMAKNVWEFGNTILENAPVIFGLGIIEDTFHCTYKIVAVPAERIPAEEPGLLLEAKELIPGIPFEKIDVLFVDEIGKDISGAGMDPNITGRSAIMGTWKPFVERIAVRDITEKSHRNGAGLGNADVTTQRAFKKFDFEMSYPNGITACDSIGLKIPPVMPNDRLAFKFAIHIATRIDPSVGPRIVWIKNTSTMDAFYISEALVPQVEEIPGLSLAGGLQEVAFDGEGNCADWDYS